MDFIGYLIGVKCVLNLCKICIKSKNNLNQNMHSKIDLVTIESIEIRINCYRFGSKKNDM